MTRREDDPLVRPGQRVAPGVWAIATKLAAERGRVLLRTKANTNQATTVAAKMNGGAASQYGLRAYTEALDDGPVGVWLEPLGGHRGEQE